MPNDIATETTSELKKGGYVQGTLILMLKKRPAGERTGFKQRIMPAVRAEVQRQIETMMHLNDTVKRKHGEPVFNDHSDGAYDAAVLADLAALHADATAWLRPIALALPRLVAYLRRLELANAAAQAGDAKYVASPRVDSYHGAWFELHEDLILLAGRNRADEVAAGRA